MTQVLGTKNAYYLSKDESYSEVPTMPNIMATMRRNFSLLGLLALCLIGFACAPGTAPEGGVEGDGLISTEPADGIYSEGDEIAAQFSGVFSIQAESITADTVSLDCTQSGAAALVIYTISYDTGTKKLTLVPSAPLPAGADCTVSLSGSLATDINQTLQAPSKPMIGRDDPDAEFRKATPYVDGMQPSAPSGDVAALGNFTWDFSTEGVPQVGPDETEPVPDEPEAKGAEGDDCNIDEDCEAGLTCSLGACIAPAADPCADGVKTNDESDVDCGGSCPIKCADGLACGSDDDCESDKCEADICVENPCKNGIMDGNETDEDCGGPDCPGCGIGGDCDTADDCRQIITTECVDGKCSSAGEETI